MLFNSIEFLIYLITFLPDSFYLDHVHFKDEYLDEVRKTLNYD